MSCRSSFQALQDHNDIIPECGDFFQSLCRSFAKFIIPKMCSTSRNETYVFHCWSKFREFFSECREICAILINLEQLLEILEKVFTALESRTLFSRKQPVFYSSLPASFERKLRLWTFVLWSGKARRPAAERCRRWRIRSSPTSCGA